MLFDNSFNYWFYTGLIYLIVLTYQDFKNKRMVDDRINYMMFGVTFSLVSHANVNLIYLFSTVIISTFLLIFLNRIKALGAADNKTLTWIFSGLSIISTPVMVYYIVIFGGILSALLILKKYLFRYEPPIPFYPAFLATFILTMMQFRYF